MKVVRTEWLRLTAMSPMHRLVVVGARVESVMNSAE
jgi:hypothetical protein